MAQVVDGRVRLWSRTGRDWTAAVPELGALGALGPVVVDGELVVATSDGRADFDLLGRRMHDRRSAGPPVTLYVFDLLRLDARELCPLPWQERRAVLEDLGVAEVTDGAARVVPWVTDGPAMHRATAEIQAEGTVSVSAPRTVRAAPSTG